MMYQRSAKCVKHNDGKSVHSVDVRWVQYDLCNHWCKAIGKGSGIYCIVRIGASAYGRTSYETLQGTSWIPTKLTNVLFYII